MVGLSAAVKADALVAYWAGDLAVQMEFRMAVRKAGKMDVKMAETKVYWMVELLADG
jgi:hypothetical protein